MNGDNPRPGILIVQCCWPLSFTNDVGVSLGVASKIAESKRGVFSLNAAGIQIKVLGQSKSRASLIPCQRPCRARLSLEYRGRWRRLVTEVLAVPGSQFFRVLHLAAHTSGSGHTISPRHHQEVFFIVLVVGFRDYLRRLLPLLGQYLTL